MHTLHQILRLQHHRHTGKMLHHRHTSYRALAVVFAAAGVCMLGLSVASRAAADNFGVTATVAAPAPANPPIIHSPGDGASTSGTSTLVTGSCPLITPQAVVSVSVDGVPGGTGACDSSNDFSVPVTLGSGKHQITATALSVTGQKGPTSAPIQVSSNGNAAPGIAITAGQPFIYAGAKDVTWTGSVGVSGQGTEYVHVDWGDNTQSNYATQAGPQSFSHHYAVLTSHNILVAASNISGASSTEQFAAGAFTTYSPPVSGGTTAGTPFFNNTTVIGLYGLYITALAVTGIIWLEAKHTARQHQHAVA